MILLIDNYDSFVYNLAHYLEELGKGVLVVRNDRVTVEGIRSLSPEAIVISPGPCTPTEAGVSRSVVREFAGRVPILGVCLGHQAIGEVFGGTVTRAAKPIHGKTAAIRHDGSGLFDGLPNPLTVTRYHSLIVELPEESPLEVLSRTEEGEIMALRHRDLPVFGVQFHPEAVLTQGGHDLLRNFLALGGVK